AAGLTPRDRPGDFAQAMMDLGATICTPKRPSCLMCPMSRECAARAAGIEAQLPARLVKGERPTRYGIAFVALREDGCVLLRRRPDRGLLAHMMEVPSTDWRDDERPAADALRSQPVRADWWLVPGSVTHTFTHFRLELRVYRAVVAADSGLTFWADAPRCQWVERRALAPQARPRLLRKGGGPGLREV